MKFLLKKQLGSIKKINAVDRIPIKRAKDFLYLEDSQQLSYQIQNNNKSFFIIGDLVLDSEKETDFEFLMNHLVNNSIHLLGGFYYLIYINNINGECRVYSSLFGVLPVYYSEQGNTILISSSISLILGYLDETPKINKKYLLERVLFNYGLFNDTYYETIKLLSANSYLLLIEKKSEQRQFEISDLYNEDYSKGEKTLEKLSASFILYSKKYLPTTNYAQSFTGGFDGRTLLSVSKYHNRDFFTYAFGTEDSIDMNIPKEQSKILGLDFMPLILDNDYVNNFSYDCGLDMIFLTEGNASFSRAHYLFAVKKLALKTKYMITGNFGSELFRAMHNPGVMLSKELIGIFDSQDDEWIKGITQSSKLNYLRMQGFKVEINQLIEEILAFKKDNKSLKANELFYVYVLSEVFRKYFGPEIVMESSFLVNRAPFLDFKFIKELFNTYYCGIYSDFFTDNPLKRYKGQILYAYIIKNTYEDLMYLNTDKGYVPAALINNTKKASLFTGYIRKKLKRRSRIAKGYDPQAVQSAYENNRQKWFSFPIIGEYYNASYLRDLYNVPILNENLANIISSNIFLLHKGKK